VNNAAVNDIGMTLFLDLHSDSNPYLNLYPELCLLEMLDIFNLQQLLISLKTSQMSPVGLSSKCPLQNAVAEQFDTKDLAGAEIGRDSTPMADDAMCTGPTISISPRNATPELTTYTWDQ
jgi:hypothetical protein